MPTDRATSSCQRSFLVVSVDGGAASGKSSTCRAVAEKLHFLHVDTGTHYRAVTRLCLDQGLFPGSQPTVLAAFLRRLQLSTVIQGVEAELRIDGTAFSREQLRSSEVNAAVSPMAAIPEVRKTVFAYQRHQAAVAREAGFHGLIMEGRDIGTVIFPEADCKFHFSADTATRTARRASEGLTDTIQQRDAIDSSRETAPLICAPDAILIDTSRHSLEEVVDMVCHIILSRARPNQPLRSGNCPCQPL